MDSQEKSGRSSSNISTEDILKALDSYGERRKLSPSTVDRSKALNRDSGLSCSESCSSFISDPLSVNGEGQSVLSDSEHLSDFTGDNFSVISDPLGAYSASDDGEGDNDIHFFETKPWDEKQNLEREWKLLFTTENYFSELSQHALSGKLKHSKYRSIAWKLFLDCLPEDQDQWITRTKQLRYEYKTFKQKSLIDPSTSKEDVESLHILHPLSLDESSPWKQFFKDNELKALIKQDLDRLYPEIEFFNSSNIKETLLNLLFCYAKKNESLGYKQGMHELLAPIVYVLDCDSKSHKYADSINETIGCLLDPNYIEHDAFAMFCQLMEVTETWYQHHNISYENTTNEFLSKSEPFAAPLTAPPTAIVKKLNKIQDHLLRKHDTDLWFHLKEMNIEPQVYGLRWIRLLFSREFPFNDVLIIWDALFAEGRHLDLVEYIYIVMLQTIRGKLMASNYTTCMSYLMKFPHIHEDVHVIVKRAMNLRGVKKSRPLSRTLQLRPSGQTSHKKHSEKKTVDRSDLFAGKTQQKKSSPRRPHTAIANFTKRYTSQFVEPKLPGLPSSKHDQPEKPPTPKEMINKPFREAKSDPLSASTTRERTDSTGSATGRTMKSLSNELKTKLTRPRTRSRQSVEELEKDHQRLQIQVSELNSEIDRMQGLYLYCGRKLDSYIGLLQEEIMRDAEADRDVIYLSLAGLKQVRDLLKGTLSYRGSSMETEKDFFDIDKGIATRLQISSPNVHPEDPSRVDSQGKDHQSETSSLSLPDDNIKTRNPNNEAQQAEHDQNISKECLPESHSINTTFGDEISTNVNITASPVLCTLSNLDSYIEQHFSSSNQPLTAVSCATGSTMSCSGSSDLSKDFLQDISNVSTPDETLTKDFVFVNQDGTAVKSAEVSPRLSPTHPLMEIDENDS